ncbi:diaminopimelate epimerase [Candidatus Berkiella aquae]|uniref:Diaminopimelate epimerase n=1 Tax=Candidatus Berkiella aquae TaxID=295108 RepID=A0AAE3HY60_9GAMM|nr:diaminopimelate epimerase [Candidatus Berkiella aquae]
MRFTKMHGLGNDFVILDNISQGIKVDSSLIRKIADRHFGIGCDQVLMVEPPNSPELDFNYRIFNADGKEVSQCGNGARCFGRYVYEKGLTDKKHIQIGTYSGTMEIDVSDLTHIRVDMGIPQFSPKAVPLNHKYFHKLANTGRYRINLLGNEREVTILSIGNPHCIISVPATSEAAVNEVGKALQEHPAFPKGVNVSFIQVLARNHVKCRVYERGVGETLACGSAACACVIAGILQEELNSEVKVDMPGGSLTVSWRPEMPVYLSGPAKSVFQGEFYLSINEEIF